MLSARKQVKQWVREGRELAGLPDVDSEGAFSVLLTMYYNIVLEIGR